MREGVATKTEPAGRFHPVRLDDRSDTGPVYRNSASRLFGRSVSALRNWTQTGHERRGARHSANTSSHLPSGLNWQSL